MTPFAKLASALTLTTSAFFALTAPSHATLIGDAVTCSDTVFNECSPASALVGAGQEFIQYGSLIGIDVQAFDIVLSNLLPTANIGLTFAGALTIGDLDFQGGARTIVGFSLATNNGVTDLTQSDLSFGADSVTVDLQGTTFTAGNSNATLHIETRLNNAVPEPATLALFGLGLAGFGLGRRRLK